jgi:hypothetical protein
MDTASQFMNPIEASVESGAFVICVFVCKHRISSNKIHNEIFRKNVQYFNFTTYSKFSMYYIQLAFGDGIAQWYTAGLNDRVFDSSVWARNLSPHHRTQTCSGCPPRLLYDG